MPKVATPTRREAWDGNTQTLFAAAEASAKAFEEAGLEVNVSSTAHWTTGHQDEQSVEGMREALRFAEQPLKVGLWVRASTSPQLVVIVTGRAYPTPTIAVRGEGQDADLTNRAFEAACQIAFAAAETPATEAPLTRELPDASLEPPAREHDSRESKRTRVVARIEDHPVIASTTVGLLAVIVSIVAVVTR